MPPFPGRQHDRLHHTWRLRALDGSMAEIVATAAEAPQRLIVGDMDVAEASTNKRGTDEAYAANFYKQSIDIGIAGMTAKASEVERMKALEEELQQEVQLQKEKKRRC